jgi:cytosine/uracil/thiamine/allantoin permease
MYDYAWFVGFGASALAYLILMTIIRPGRIVLQTEES